MSDNDNILYMPGVEPPCDVEPSDPDNKWDAALERVSKSVDRMTGNTIFSEVMDDHRKAHNHATDTNPNVVEPHNDYGSVSYPHIRFQWTANKAYWRVQVDPKGHVDIPVTLREVIRTLWSMVGWINHKT